MNPHRAKWLRDRHNYRASKASDGDGGEYYRHENESYWKQFVPNHVGKYFLFYSCADVLLARQKYSFKRKFPLYLFTSKLSSEIANRLQKSALLESFGGLPW